MFLDGTGTVVNEDWTWADAWADLGLRPTLDDLGLSLGPLLDQPWADFGNMFLRYRESVVETGQMSSVETRQMSQQQSRHLSCLNRRRDSCRPPAGGCYVSVETG